MHLDVTTLRFSESAIALLLAILSGLLWSTGRMYPGFGYWTLAKIVGTVGYALAIVYNARSVIALAMAAAGIGSVLLSLEACRSFFGLRVRTLLNWSIAGIYLLVILYSGIILKSPSAVVVETLLVVGMLNGWTSWVLFRRTAPGAILGKNTTAFIFAALAIAYVGTGLRFTVAPPGPEARIWYLTFSAVTQSALIVANFGFFWMHYERLLRDREEEAAHTARLNHDLRQLKDHLEETVQKKTAELIRSQKLEGIGRVAGGIAHDFNNLLTVLLGHANLVQAKMSYSNPLRTHIDRMVSVCEEASSLTEALLAFGRQQSAEPSLLSINDVIHKVESLMRDMVGDSIEVAIKVDPSLGYVLADRGQLRQVLINLVLNARDAMPDGGQLAITTENVRVGEMEPQTVPTGSYVVLAVADTGFGMDEQTRSRIFEPFFTTKDSHTRTGLGLATVYGIVKQSTGHIQVESEPLKGTTFRILFPSAEHQIVRDAGNCLDSSPEPLPTANILVVEDYKELRALIGEVLREAGYGVMEAASGREALSLLRKHQGRLDLIMTDLAMPEMDGQTFAEQVHRAYPELKIVFMSAYPEAVLAHAGSKQKRIQVLRKPFTDQDLTARVREVLNPA